jgi:hypothetical protein
VCAVPLPDSDCPVNRAASAREKRTTTASVVTWTIARDARQHVTVFIASNDETTLRLSTKLLEFEDNASAIYANLGQWTWVPINRCLSRHAPAPVQISRQSSNVSLVNAAAGFSERLSVI